MNIFDIFPELKNKYTEDDLNKRQFELAEMEATTFVNYSIKNLQIDKIKYYLKYCSTHQADSLFIKILLEEDLDEWFDLFDTINYHEKLPDACLISFKIGFTRFFKNLKSMKAIDNYKKRAIIDVVYYNRDLNIIDQNFGINDIGLYTIKDIEYYNKEHYLGGLSLLYTLTDWVDEINDYLLSKFLDIKVLNQVIKNSNKINIKNKISKF